MKKLYVTLLVATFLSIHDVYSQGIGVNNNGSQPDASSMLDVVSDSKGVLIPRMTTNEQLAINSPAVGLLIFNTDSVNFWFFDGTVWRAICNCDIISVTPNICPDSIVDSRDNKVYKTVLIGQQCWMAENLNVGSMINGANDQSNVAGTFQKYCYNNSSANCNTYGGLYQWNHAVQYWGVGNPTYPAQGVCPTGWHVPADTEWMILEEYLGMCSGTNPGCSNTIGYSRGTNEGDKLRKPGLVPDICFGSTPPCGSTGFNAIMAGHRNPPSSFVAQPNNTSWTTATESSNTDMYVRHMMSFSATINRHSGMDKLSAYSVRCLKD